MALALTLLMSRNILWLLHRALLPKLGVNRNFSLTIILLAAVVGGLGLKSLELEKGLERLAHLADLWISSNLSSTLLWTSLELL